MPITFFLKNIKMTNWENNEEIKIFREYLKIPSVHPNIDYGNYFDQTYKDLFLIYFQNPV